MKKSSGSARAAWRGMHWIVSFFAAMAMLLTACGSAGSDSTDAGGNELAAPDDGDLQPKPGGVLRLGAIGGGQTETLNPGIAAATVDYARVAALYERLVAPDGKGGLDYELATELTPNADASEWTVKLRDDVHFSDGHTLSADDVLYTWEQAEKNNWKGALITNMIDLERTTKVDNLTIKVTLKKPNSLLPELFASSGMEIFAAGTTDFTKGNGTGPFNLESFTPGDRSVMVRKDNYWRGDNLPYLDRLEIISLSGYEAGENALKGGQLDALAKLPFAQAKSIQNTPGLKVYAQDGAIAPSFSFRVDTEPFVDMRVREAMKLAIDREKCVELALNGYGAVANDLVGPASKTYNSDVPQRPYDPEQAKKLLAEAGRESISVVLEVGPASPAMLPCAQVYQQSAKAAGIDIEIKQIPASDVYNRGAGYMTRTFGMTEINGRPFEQYVLTGLLRGARNNDTHFYDPGVEETYEKALAIVDPEQRNKELQAIQEKIWREGGAIVWGTQDTLFAFTEQVRGVEAWLSKNPDLNPYKRLDLVWLNR